MSGFTDGTRAGSATQTVRTIGRLAQMLMELRDEYVERERDDILLQIEQRLADLAELRVELQAKIEQARDSA